MTLRRKVILTCDFCNSEYVCDHEETIKEAKKYFTMSGLLVFGLKTFCDYKCKDDYYEIKGKE